MFLPERKFPTAMRSRAHAASLRIQGSRGTSMFSLKGTFIKIHFKTFAASPCLLFHILFFATLSPCDILLCSLILSVHTFFRPLHVVYVQGVVYVHFSGWASQIIVSSNTCKTRIANYARSMDMSPGPADMMSKVLLQQGVVENMKAKASYPTKQGPYMSHPWSPWVLFFDPGSLRG